MSECVICRLVAHQIPAWIVHEEADVICFLPLEVEVYGHIVLAPRLHFADLYQAPVDVVGRVMSVAQTLALHFRDSTGASGVNLLHASGAAAQQSVPHFYIHLILRFEGDDLDLWPRLPSCQHDKDEMLQRLRF